MVKSSVRVSSLILKISTPTLGERSVPSAATTFTTRPFRLSKPRERDELRTKRTSSAADATTGDARARTAQKAARIATSAFLRHLGHPPPFLEGGVRDALRVRCARCAKAHLPPDPATFIVKTVSRIPLMGTCPSIDAYFTTIPTCGANDMSTFGVRLIEATNRKDGNIRSECRHPKSMICLYKCASFQPDFKTRSKTT